MFHANNTSDTMIETLSWPRSEAEQRGGASSTSRLRLGQQESCDGRVGGSGDKVNRWFPVGEEYRLFHNH